MPLRFVMMDSMIHLDDKQKAAEAALDGAFKELRNLRSLIERGKLNGKSKIRERVNKIVAKYNLSKHVTVDIRQADFDVRIENMADATAAALEFACQAINGVRSGQLHQNLA